MASIPRKVSDTDLVFSLLSQLRARISLALALTVRNLSVDECRRKISKKLLVVSEMPALDVVVFFLGGNDNLSF